MITKQPPWNLSYLMFSYVSEMSSQLEYEKHGARDVDKEMSKMEKQFRMDLEQTRKVFLLFDSLKAYSTPQNRNWTKLEQRTSRKLVKYHLKKVCTDLSISSWFTTLFM